jgi:hypothetical protein
MMPHADVDVHTAAFKLRTYQMNLKILKHSFHSIGIFTNMPGQHYGKWALDDACCLLQVLRRCKPSATLHHPHAKVDCSAQKLECMYPQACLALS